MPRYNEIINNFINGEVSPKVFGRTDSEVYKRSCEELRNMLSHPQGGASRRTGTRFVYDYLPILDSSADDVVVAISEGARTVPFVFDDDEKYLLIFNKTQDSSGVNTLQYYFVDENWVVATNFDDDKIVNYNGVYTSRATDNFKTIETSDLLQDDTVIAEMQYAQAGAVMIFTHPQLPPFCVIRESRGRLQYVPYSYQFTADVSTKFGPWPFSDLNVSDLKIHANGTSGSVTLTTTDDFFDSGHVGSPLCFSDSGTIGYGLITAVASSTSSTFQVIRSLPPGMTTGTAGTDGTTLWYESAWSDYRGYPRSVAYLNGAIYFGGSPTFPDRIWKSQDFDIFEMCNLKTQGSGDAVGASDPFYGDLAVGRGISQINAIVSYNNDLIVLTRNREYAVQSFNSTEINVKPQTGNGSEYVQPVVVEDAPIYVQRGFRKLREVIFDDRIQGYASPDITYLAEHMPRQGLYEITGATSRSKIKQLEYQALDNSIVWALDNNGFIFAATKSRLGGVNAFHRHSVGGNGVVQSIAALPSKDGTYDDLYLVVKRTINSTTKVYLERIGPEFQETTLDVDTDNTDRLPVFSDCSKVFRRSHGEANFYASLKSSVDADVAGGTATGTATGTISFVQNKALFSKSAASYVDYDGTSNADFPQTGTIRFWTILSSPDSTLRRTIFAISKAAGDADNLIELAIQNSGYPTSQVVNLHLTINDSAGNPIINNVNLGDMNDRANGTGFKIPQFIEICYDLTGGATRVFINGEQFGSTQTGTGTRDTSIDLIRIGHDIDATSGENIEESLIWDFQIFDSVLHTADYTVFDYQPTGVTLKNLDYLEGESVQVTADGNYVGDFTVSSGQIADIGADYSASKTIVVGKSYTSRLKTLPIEAGAGIGSSIGAIKRIDRASVRFRETAAAKVGPSSSDLDPIIFRDDSTPADEAIVPVTNDTRVDFDGDYTRRASLVIETSDPLPMNVTCVTMRGVTGDV